MAHSLILRFSAMCCAKSFWPHIKKQKKKGVAIDQTCLNYFASELKWKSGSTALRPAMRPAMRPARGTWSLGDGEQLGSDPTLTLLRTAYPGLVGPVMDRSPAPDSLAAATNTSKECTSSDPCDNCFLPILAAITRYFFSSVLAQLFLFSVTCGAQRKTIF